MRIFGWRCWRRMRRCHSLFEVNYKGLVLGRFRLHVPGRHNVLNATAAVAVGVQLGGGAGSDCGGAGEFSWGGPAVSGEGCGAGRDGGG